MTGFGRGEARGSSFSVTVEIKSVNHRFRDIRFKMGSALAALELELKKELSDKLSRGSFDVSVSYRRAEENPRFDELDGAKVEAYLKRMNEIATKAKVTLAVNPTDFLRPEFMEEKDLTKDAELMDLVRAAFSSALKAIEASRAEEGKKLVVVLNDHVTNYRREFAVIESRAQDFRKAVEEKLKKRFEEYGKELNVEEPRFLQEVVYYLEKLDVQEEMDRVRSHLKKMDDLLAGSGETGRQMEFLLQELGRETNTLGSKSSIKEISDAVVQMKVCLEKMREQGLNIE
jgi:uncharacterized protein (TIGR00255 family)